MVTPNSMSTELERLFMALAVRTQIEATAMLGVRQSTLSDCKRRESVVSGILLERDLKIGIRREWIKAGELPMRRESFSDRRCEAGRYCPEVCPALEAVQQAASLIASCGYICDACEYKVRVTASATE